MAWTKAQASNFAKHAMARAAAAWDSGLLSPMVKQALLVVGLEGDNDLQHLLVDLISIGAIRQLRIDMRKAGGL